MKEINFLIESMIKIWISIQSTLLISRLRILQILIQKKHQKEKESISTLVYYFSMILMNLLNAEGSKPKKMTFLHLSTIKKW